MLDHNHTTFPPKARKVLLGLLAVLTNLMWLGISAGQTPTLSIDRQHGEVGETVSFTVWVDRAPNDVGAFSFEVTYDPEVLEYKHKVQGELLRPFVFNAIARGDRVQVAGFSAKEFTAGSSGRLVTLEFEVKNPGDSELAIENLVDHIASWSVQSGSFISTSPPAVSEQAEESTPQQLSSDRPEESAPQPSPDQPEAVSPEPQLTMAEQLEQQVNAVLSEASNPPPTTSRPAATPARPIQSQAAGILTQPLIMNRVTKPTEPKGDAQAQARQEQAAPRPTVAEEVQNTPSVEAALPPQSPQTVAAKPTADVVSESHTALHGTAPHLAPTMEPPRQQQAAMGDSAATQAMAKLVSEQPAVSSRESVSERSLVVPVDATATSRGATPSTESVSESGFLSQTLRVVLLFVAVALLCIVGAVLVILKKH